MNNERRRAEYQFRGRVRDPSNWDRIRLAIGTVLVIASVGTCALLAVDLLVFWVVK